MKIRILLLLSLIVAGSADAQSAAATDIHKRATGRRAVEAVVWGMPAVNFDRMLQAALANGATAR